MTATDVSTRARQIVTQRSGGRCEVCGVAPATEISHRRPKGMGGTSVAERHLPSWLVHACHDCHQGPNGLESNRLLAQALGLLLDPGEHPSTTPAFLRTVFGAQWVTLDDDGMYLVDWARPAPSVTLPLP